MINKIVSISNIGHFVNYQFNGKDGWNGQLAKIVTIYAENGSGKTTLSTIFKSLSSDGSQLINFKKSFGAVEIPNIKLIVDNNTVNYDGKEWSKKLNIEVFDINYIEDYLFVGSISKKQNKTNLYNLILGAKGKEFKDRIKPLIKKKLEFKKQSQLSTKIFIEELDNEYKKINDEYDNYTKRIYKKHYTLINNYLKIFCPYIKFLRFDHEYGSTGYELYNLVPVYEIYGREIRFTWPSETTKYSNARYSLSEGDKSTIALSFFLARLSLNKDKSKIIVIDDPLSSFDYSRRTSTINQLVSILNNCNQFFLLSHDINFIFSFTKKCRSLSQSIINLEIIKKSNGSKLYSQNIDRELLNDFQNCFIDIKRYLNEGKKSCKREIAANIRVVLEGILKEKFFDLLPHDKELGELIKIISKAKKDSPLAHVKKLKDKIIQLNDFSLQYHHSELDKSNTKINDTELTQNINLLLQIYYKI